MRTKRQLARDDAKELAEFYSSAHNKLVRILVEGQASLTSRKRAKEMLFEVRQVIDGLDQRTQRFIENKIPIHYTRHAKDALKNVKSIDVRFTKVHENAIKAFADSTKDKFAIGLATTERKASQVINQTLQKNITREIAKGQIIGSSLPEITDDVIKQIENQGITGLVDKRGRNLNIAAYAKTLAYTEIANAGRTAVANAALQYDLDLVVVSSHNSKHHECAIFENKVLSITGKTKGYPTIEDARNVGLFHPGCLHSYTIIDPEDITDDMRS